MSNNQLSLPYTLTQIVEKVYYYTGKSLSEKDKLTNGIYVMASISEDYRLKAREELFKLQLEIQNVKGMIDDRCWNISSQSINAANVTSYIEVVNRCSDYLTISLKELLRPVWNVYWNESCEGLGSICVWLLKADEDNGVKVAAKLSAVDS